nr:hypothetical protein GCM10020092_078950 [Actinoplanes digitatis]
MTSPPCPACPRKGNRSSNAHRVPRSALPHPENKPSFNTQTHSAAHPGPDAAQGAADTPQRPPGRDDDLKKTSWRLTAATAAWSKDSSTDRHSESWGSSIAQ